MVFELEAEEIIQLFFCSSVFLIILFKYKDIKSFPSFKIIFSCYCFLVLGVFFDVLESYFFPDIFNIIQHISYAIMSLLFLIWAITVLLITKKEDMK